MKLRCRLIVVSKSVLAGERVRWDRTEATMVSV